MYKYRTFDEYWNEIGNEIDNASICVVFKIGLKELVKHGFDSAREVIIPSKEEVEAGLNEFKQSCRLIQVELKDRILPQIEEQY